MGADRTAFSDLKEGRAVSRRTVVSEIRERECRRVLDVRIEAEPSVGRERIVRAVDRRRECKWRQSLISPERFEGREVAHSVVDAEIHIARVDLADLEAVVRTRGSPLHQLASEGNARAVATIDVDAGCTATVREQSERKLVVRRAEPRLPQVDARV